VSLFLASRDPAAISVLHQLADVVELELSNKAGAEDIRAASKALQ
jgi:hypothetical protein